MCLSMPVRRVLFSPWKCGGAAGISPTASGGGGTSPAAPSTIDMSNWTNYYEGAGGGCFSPDSLVTILKHEQANSYLFDWMSKQIPASSKQANSISAFATPCRIEDVRPGDRVRVADMSFATVKCVVKIARKGGKHLIEFPGTGLSITPKHPIWNWLENKWELPMNMVKNVVENDSGLPSIASCGSLCSIRSDTDTLGSLLKARAVMQYEDHFVYNLVLEEGKHTLLMGINILETANMTFGGIPCATWCHGLTGDVIQHNFFGTDKILQSLERMPGWANGFIVHPKPVLAPGEVAADYLENLGKLTPTGKARSRLRRTTFFEGTPSEERSMLRRTSHFTGTESDELSVLLEFPEIEEHNNNIARFILATKNIFYDAQAAGVDCVDYDAVRQVLKLPMSPDIIGIQKTTFVSPDKFGSATDYRPIKNNPSKLVVRRDRNETLGTL